MELDAPSYYPVFLDLQGKRCVVLGGGATAEGKIAKLKAAGAKVTVVSPQVTGPIRSASQSGELEWHAREYYPGDLAGAFLAIAATNARSVNQRISREAQDLGVLLNVVDEPSQCTFIAPSVIHRGPVTLAISTGGASPALARKLRHSLSASPALEWADLSGIMSQARSRVKTQGAAVDPQRWQCCLTPELLSLVHGGRCGDALAAMLSDLLDGSNSDLCPRVDRCQPEGCRLRPTEILE